MKQKRVFLVESGGSPLQDDDVLLYNDRTKCFYKTSAKSLLAEQNAKIKKFMDKTIEEKETIKQENEKLKKEFEALKESNENFINQTKTITDKLIDMVDKFVIMMSN